MDEVAQSLLAAQQQAEALPTLTAGQLYDFVVAAAAQYG